MSGVPNKRVLLTAGVVLALGSLAGSYVVLGGDSDPTVPPDPVAVAAQPAAAEASADDVALPLELPMVTYEVYLARDPFEPVREPAEPEPTPTVTTAPTPTSTSSSTDDGAVTSDPDDVTVQPAPTSPSGDDPWTDRASCRDQGEIVCDGVPITLADVVLVDGVLVAHVTVGSETYEVREGATFASRLRVLSISEDAVTLLYADEAFTLQLGEGSRSLK
jgi:hypothetical protein